MLRAMQLVIALAVLLFAFVAAAQGPIVYPARGQSTQQQSQDEAQCAAWANQSTGIDLALDQASGTMTVTLVNREGAVVLFGSCTPL